jgi:epoxyqueuosine reductase QueG
MVTNQKIKLIAQNCGADLCGVAPVERFSMAPEGFHPRDIFSGTNSVVVFGLKMPDSAFASRAPVPYTFISTQIFGEVNRLTLAMVVELEALGKVAVPVPSEPYEYWERETMTGKGILSLRHAAELAGLGTLTRNHLLTNAQFGNRITLGALLTDAEITPDPIATGPECPQGCGICRDRCPVKAITDESVNQKLCRSIAEGRNEKGYFLYWCRACREECPLSKGKKV